MPDLATLTTEDFEPLLNQEFGLLSGEEQGGAMVLRLAAVDRLGQSDRQGGGFALTFLAPPGPFLPQAIYAIEHASLGRQELFLVPLGPQDGGNAYEAVFA